MSEARYKVGDVVFFELMWWTKSLEDGVKPQRATILYCEIDGIHEMWSYKVLCSDGTYAVVHEEEILGNIDEKEFGMEKFIKNYERIFRLQQPA